MKLNLINGRTLCLILATCIIASLASAQIDNEVDYQSQPRFSNGFFNLLMTPVRTTIEQAKNFLGHRIDNIQSGTDSIRQQTFQMFMQLYNKSYPIDEIPRRMELFFERKNMIEESVQAFNEGKISFVLRENPFIDWDDDEKKRLTGVSLPSRKELAREEAEYGLGSVSGGRYTRSTDFQIEEEDQHQNHQQRSYENSNALDEDRMIVKQVERIPASVDWRESGCVAAPINQEKCGACYAISTMGVLETMRCLNQVSSPTLSPQQVVDCSTPRTGYANYGCDGGWPTRVLKYLQATGVAAREKCYPFVWRQNSCKLSQVRAVAGCTVSASPTNGRLSYKVLNNERDILYHVAKTGPVVTVMKASDRFLYYGRGIFDDPTCSNRREDVDHAIVIVGYGKENGVDYWLIKNSWGREWGENGYGRYRRGKNACSIGHWGWVISS